MNILHIIFSFNNGGTENLMVDLLNSWNNEQDKLLLCIVNDFYDDALLKKITNKRVDILKLNRKPGSSKFNGMRQLREVVKKNKIDIIHCHSANVFNYILLALGYSFRRKYVLTIHNVSVYKALSRSTVFLHKLFLHKITAISESVKESIIRRGFPQNRIEVIYNGIDFHKYRIEHIEHNKTRILCVGRMVPPIKGQDILIRAMKYVSQKRSDVECVFAGGNPENYDYISDMKALALQEGVLKNIEFLGDCHNIPQQMALSDILVVPSREEGFGLVVVEGMASKIPVISTRTGGPSEIIDDRNNGYLVECDNPEALARRILQILDEDQTQVIDTAFKTAYNNYDIHRTGQSMRKAYE